MFPDICISRPGVMFMEFLYNCAKLPKDHKSLSIINSAAERLFKRLKNLRVEELDISDYNRTYLKSYLEDLYGTLQKYSYILALSLSTSNLSLNKLTFIDYGGGTGILSLLAKECDIGTVIYNDIYDVSCKDAKTIAQIIGNEIDYYIQGEIDDLIKFLRKKSMSCNAIASSDVIEHIYDITKFFQKMKFLPGKSITVVMSSGANMLNPIINRSIMKQQREIEYTDRVKIKGHKKRDCLKAYSKVRREIISNFEGLTNEEIARLTKATRGMIKEDIEKTISVYLKTSRLPKEPIHPTNTCDPYTGNWAEHLMDPFKLKEILAEEGFKVEVLNGYYTESKDIIRRIIYSLLNLSITKLKKQGIRLSPFYTIYGVKN